MKNKSIIKLILTVSVSVILIFFTLSNVRKLRAIKRNEAKIKNSVEKQLSLLAGKKIDLSSFELFKEGKNGSNKTAQFKLLAFFSIHGCGNCLFDELAEWERIYKENHNFKVFAICIDDNKSDVYRFTSHFSPTIPVYRNKVTDFSFAKIATSVLVLDENNIVDYFYYSERGNEEKRYNFYELLDSL